MAVAMVPIIAFPSDHFAESIRPRISGIATAAKIPTIKMTTINSISVKPFLSLFFPIF
jgi:hypothetical protein